MFRLAYFRIIISFMDFSRHYVLFIIDCVSFWVSDFIMNKWLDKVPSWKYVYFTGLRVFGKNGRAIAHNWAVYVIPYITRNGRYFG